VYAAEVTVPGCHFHFISDDKKLGGHVLEFITELGSAEIEKCDRFLLIMPESP
jgi:acetolactate decarboxylase